MDIKRCKLWPLIRLLCSVSIWLMSINVCFLKDLNIYFLKYQNDELREEDCVYNKVCNFVNKSNTRYDVTNNTLRVLCANSAVLNTNVLSWCRHSRTGQIIIMSDLQSLVLCIRPYIINKENSNYVWGQKSNRKMKGSPSALHPLPPALCWLRNKHFLEYYYFIPSDCRKGS